MWKQCHDDADWDSSVSKHASHGAVGSLLVQVFMWIINKTRCIFPGADSCSVLLLSQSLYVSFLTKPQGSQSLTFLSSSYIKGAQWNFVDFGAKFSTSTLRFMDMMSLQTQRQASLSRLTSSTFVATGRLCQSSMGKLFSKAGVLKLGSRSSQILYIWKNPADMVTIFWWHYTVEGTLMTPQCSDCVWSAQWTSWQKKTPMVWSSWL